MILLLVYLTIGETITLDAHFSFLKLGELRLETVSESATEIETIIHYRSLLRSNPALRFLFMLEDKVESWVDKSSLRPILFTRHIAEKGYKHVDTVRFNWENGYAYYSGHDSIPVDPTATDILTLFYKLRHIDLKDSFYVVVHAGKKDYRIPCWIIARKMVKTRIGSFDTIGIGLNTEGKGIFGRGNLEIWMSDDGRRIPLIVKANFKFGSVIFRISEYHA